MNGFYVQMLRDYRRKQKKLKEIKDRVFGLDNRRNKPKNKVYRDKDLRVDVQRKQECPELKTSSKSLGSSASSAWKTTNFSDSHRSTPIIF